VQATQALSASGNVNFLPFVGDRYGDESVWEQPVLILSESHYGKNATYPEFTRAVIEDYMAGDRDGYAFFTNVIKAFLGTLPDDRMRREFWRNVSYYVYVQRALDGPRVRPTDHDWESSSAAFEEVCSALSPALILVLGTNTWNELPTASAIGPDVVLPSGHSRPSCVYAYDRIPAMAFPIPHPKAFGWRALEWTPWIRSALDTAKRFPAAHESV
jgi:hypothetical protein